MMKIRTMLLILLLLVLAIVGLGGMSMMSASIYTDKTNYTDDDSSASTDDDDSNGGGGGSASAAPATDDGCVGECPSVWIEDESARSSNLDFFSLLRFTPLTTGHYECSGTCKNEVELCIFDPTDIIPNDGFTDIDNPPNCVCLKPQSGPCNFYDDNYGVGDENIICGGYCSNDGECVRYEAENVDVCTCMYPQDSNECGFHFSEESLRCAPDECEVPDSMSEDDCYGDCSITTMCTFSYETDFSTKARVPICYCPELSDQEPDDEDEVVYCQEIKNPQSQTDCDDGMCTVLMYGVECTYIENTLGFTECVCILPEDTETQDDYVPDKSLVDQIFISTKLDTFFR